MKTRVIEIYKEHLAGVQYHDYQRAKLVAGDNLRLVWERTNPVDQNAIAVYKNKVRIGYIRAVGTHILHEYRKRGLKLHTELVSYNKNNPSWSALVVRVCGKELVNEIADEEM